MKRLEHYLTALLILVSYQFYSQVGIGTVTPNSQLDIRSSNQVTPANTDGILIPKVDNFPVTPPTVSQDGMMVYATGAGTPAKGFYYWDQGITAWVGINGDKNTLDEAYDQGGAGTGRQIEADNGSVLITGSDGLLIRGNTGAGEIIALDTSFDSQFYFNPRKAAIRAGYVSNTNWDDANVGEGSAAFGYYNIASGAGTLVSGTNNNVSGLYSFSSGVDNIVSGSTSSAIGWNATASGGSSIALNFGSIASGDSSVAANNGTTASGNSSFSINNSTIASGEYSFAQGLFSISSGLGSSSFGESTQALSYSEMAVGTNNRLYTPSSTAGFNLADRAFVVGNGVNGSNRSNAFEVWKDGRVIINEAYTLPTADGAVGQALTTNGAGALSWGSVTGANRIDDLTDGKSDVDGSNNGSSIFLGLNAGAGDDSSDNRNVGIGFSSLQTNSTGPYNTAIGYLSMYNTTSGYNTGFGALTLVLNTTGTNNVSVGSYGLYSNTSGNSNTAIGRNALYTNSTGSDNTGIGYRALDANTTGVNNTAVGSNSLLDNTIGQSNVGIGSYSLSNNTSGNNNVAMGISSMFTNTTGSNNVAIGRSALYNNTTANFNVGVGYRALFNNTTGLNNVAIGADAAVANTTGTNNVSVGYFSLNANTVGNSNVAIGRNALYRNTTASDNTAVGYRALELNTTGNANTAIGVDALQNNTTGFTNVAIGPYVLQSNTTGASNYSLGYFALNSNTTGNANVAIGLEVLQSNTSGSINTALGNNALQFNTIGSGNVGIGASALLGNTTGDNNTALGFSAGQSVSGSANVFLGYQAGYNESGSNKLYIENSSANTANALIYGEFDTDLLRLNADVEVRNDLEVDTNTLFVNSTTNRVGVGTNIPNYPLDVNGTANLNNGIASGIALRVNGSEAIWYDGTYFSWGFGGTANYFADNIGLGTTTPDTRLHIEGGSDATLGGGGYITLGDVGTTNIVIDNNEIMARNNGVAGDLHLQLDGGNVLVGGAVVHTSDRRLKKDIEPISFGLEEILKLEPKQYNWKDRSVAESKSLGLIAQDVENVIANLVVTRDDEDRTLSVNYTELIPILIKAIQEQDEKIETLEEALKKFVDQEDRLKKLEAILSNN